MGSPLYRQEQEMNRKGIYLSRQTMSNWILKATGDYLLPVYQYLHRELLTRDVLRADETTLQVLHEPGKKPQSDSYMWLEIQTNLLFCMNTSRGEEQNILKNSLPDTRGISGASGSAVMFSMIQTAIENGLDPYKYLTWLLKTAKDADISQEDALHGLMPWNAPNECRAK